MSYEFFKGIIAIYTEYDMKNECNKYYDSEMNYLGDAKDAYRVVKQHFQMGGLAVKETTRFDRFEEMGGDMETERHDTNLYFGDTNILICCYREEESAFWGPIPSRTCELLGSDYVTVKPKSEWKAPAQEAVKPVNTENSQVMIGLGLTNQELNEKYHFKYVDENKTMWAIYGGGELLETKLYLNQKELGTLTELASEPMKMLPLRNALNKAVKKDYICQCSSELGLSKDGRELYRQMVFLAEKERFNTKDNHTKASTSVLTVAKIQDIASGKVTVRVYFKQKNPDLEVKVY